MEIFISLYDKILVLAEESPIMGGVISLWGLTVVTFILKVVPLRVLIFFKTQLTSNLELDNSQGWDHKRVYFSCMKWFSTNHKALRLSRNFSIYTKEEPSDIGPSLVLGAGYGLHIFFFKKKLFWMRLTELASSGSELQKRRVVISCLGRNSSVFNSFLDEFKPKRKTNKLYAYTYAGKDGWEATSEIRKRPLESIAINRDLKKSILDSITYFDKNEEWYVEKGLPYKLTFILHGIAGTGKTSFIKALASYFNKKLCVLNINNMSDSYFESALATVPKNAILVIEDFDSSRATKSRIGNVSGIRESLKGGSVNKGKEKLKSEKIIQEPLDALLDISPVTLTGILNGLDGLHSLHGTLIFLTTNYLDRVDPAIYRKGRVDYIYEMGEASVDEVKEYSQYIYPDYDFSEVNFTATLGCNLNNALLEAKDDPTIYLKELNIL